MTPPEIKFSLDQHNVSQKDLAEQLGCSTAAISRTIKGGLVSKGIQLGIANAINTPLEKVFPKNLAA